jgi:type IV pilus assembly protein PilF
MSRSGVPRVIAAAAMSLAWSWAAVACGPSEAAQNPAQSESAQSLAEVDLAQDLWLQRGEPRLALDHTLKAIELDEDNAEAAHLAALLYLDFCNRDAQECRLDDAERYARQAIAIRDDFREAQNTLAVVLIHQKKYADAIAVLRPLSQDILYQTPENAWGNLGWAELELGHTEAAIEALRRSTAVQPEFCVGFYRLGLAYERKADLPSALDAYTRALKVDHPRCRALQVAYAARASVALQLGRQDEAVRDLEECVRLDKLTATGRQCGTLLVPLK